MCGAVYVSLCGGVYLEIDTSPKGYYYWSSCNHKKYQQKGEVLSCGHQG